ncbi:uncharacterized protein BCR38DRAFT_488202 [Pseudomassariella vexata]|uniref:Uncharacterized protein n=1 Tax=Pseudomassariella vexata TaxID=1141098 RepID=A0A1Y2DL51_9PEZI|nr:uncharacterized protein BCR38DRAFT_488202 [Pseudomassariella vexata]ORY60010.1 hypothetical protein BCR38DRAFT_488202 [Pseudomassariella vexata]
MTFFDRILLLLTFATLTITSWTQAAAIGNKYAVANTKRVTIEGEGIVVQPLTGGQTAEVGPGGKNITTTTPTEEPTSQTINLGGIPVQVSGEDITLNGKPLETGPKNTTESEDTLEVAGSDIVVNGKPLDEPGTGNTTDPGLTITIGS